MRRPNHSGLASSDNPPVPRSHRQGYPLVGGIVLTSMGAGVGIMHTSRGGIALCDSKRPPASVKTSVVAAGFTSQREIARRITFQGLPTTRGIRKNFPAARHAAIMTPLRQLP